MRQFSYTNCPIKSPNLGQDALVSVFKVLNMAATGSKAASRQRKQNADLWRVVDFSLESFDYCQWADKKTDSCQVPVWFDPCSLNYCSI